VIGVISLTDLVAFAASTPGVPTERGQTIDLAESDGGEAAANEWVEGDEPPAGFFVEHWADAGADVVERIAETAGPEWNVLEEHTVAEAMTRAIRSLSPHTPVDQAAEVMRTSSVHRVLVMSRGELLGLVTTKDIADAVADHRIAARTYVFDPKSEFDDRGWP
jgi:CBS domain-containing protein